MSMDYCFQQADVSIKFSNAKEMEQSIKKFNKEVEKIDELYAEGSIDYGIKSYAKGTDSDDLTAEIIIDSDSDEWVDIDKLAELICKYFPKANGTIGWASACESAGGFCRNAGGGYITITNGKIAPSAEQKLKSAEKKLNKLREDLDLALEYISMVVSNGDITECGVANLFKKYWKEEYKEALKEKEEK